jgi:hypothetical protein
MCVRNMCNTACSATSVGAGGLGDLRLAYFPGVNASSHLLINSCDGPHTQVRLPLNAWSNTFLVGVGSDD